MKAKTSRFISVSMIEFSNSYPSSFNDLSRQTTSSSVMNTNGSAPTAMMERIVSTLPERIITSPSAPRIAP